MSASVDAESIDASYASAIFEARRNSIATKDLLLITGIRRRFVRLEIDLVIIYILTPLVNRDLPNGFRYLLLYVFNV